MRDSSTKHLFHLYWRTVALLTPFRSHCKRHGLSLILDSERYENPDLNHTEIAVQLSLGYMVTKDFHV